MFLQLWGVVSISKVKFGFYLVEPVGLEDALKYGVEAEKWGFDVVAACENLFWWTPGQSSVWDNFTVLNAVMNRTRKIKIMTDVIDPVKRHPAVVAHMLATMDNIGKGRIQGVGIGAGEIANFGPLLDLNGPRKPAEMIIRLREFVTVMRGVWNSTQMNPFSFDGNYFKVKDAFLSLKPFTKPHPPIYLAALGPKMRKLAGEIANGWIPLTHAAEVYKKDVEEIANSAKSAGRDPNAIDTGLTIYTSVLKDSDRAKKMGVVRGRLDLAARPALLKDLGYESLAEELKILNWATRDGPVTENVSRAKDSHDRAINEIPEEATRKVNICGNPDEAIEKIEGFMEAGARLFILWPPYEEKDALQETIRNYRNKILPYFGKKRK